MIRNDLVPKTREQNNVTEHSRALTFLIPCFSISEVRSVGVSSMFFPRLLSQVLYFLFFPCLVIPQASPFPYFPRRVDFC